MAEEERREGDQIDPKEGLRGLDEIPEAHHFAIEFSERRDGTAGELGRLGSGGPFESAVPALKLTGEEYGCTRANDARKERSGQQRRRSPP